MNILLDFIPLQFNKGIGGAATFAKKVCDEVISQKDADTKLFATYDSTVETSRLYNHEYIAKQANITLIDISAIPISFAIEQNKIDVFFIAIGQFYARYNLTGIECKVVMFIHDIFDIERNDNLIDLALPFTRCKGKIQKKWISYREQHLENLEVQAEACTFAQQTLNQIEQLKTNAIQQI